MFWIAYGLIAVVMFIYLARKKYDPATVWTEGVVIMFSIMWPIVLYGYMTAWLIDRNYTWIITPIQWVILEIRKW
jgi:hypothetical protein